MEDFLHEGLKLAVENNIFDQVTISPFHDQEMVEILEKVIARVKGQFPKVVVSEDDDSIGHAN